MTPGTSVRIRPFQPDDAGRLIALASRLTEGVAAWREPAAVARAARGWVEGSLSASAQPGHAVFVAVVAGRVTGFVTVCEQAHFTGQRDAYIGELAVAPGMERRGIATALLEEVEAWAAGRGLEFLTLHTGVANGPARALYSALGYRDEDIRLTKAVTRG